MSDFLNAGWSTYITLVSLLGIIWCIWLLFSQRSVAVTYEADGTVQDTGHIWDEDLRELNHPLPRWWMWMFLLSCGFALVYLVLYPGLGSFTGILGYSSQKALSQSMISANEELKPIYAKYLQMQIEQVATDPQARAIGQRLFLNACAQCHGSDGGGSKGFPNLTDQDWLYGGSPQQIQTTLEQGRAGVMPSFAHLEGKQVSDVANYVRSLSGLTNNDLKTARGTQVFKTHCVACHGSMGEGNILLGAPNLSDKIWLYGASEATIIETLQRGRIAHMPAQNKILSPEKIHLLTAYVWGLSHAQPLMVK